MTDALREAVDALTKPEKRQYRQPVLEDDKTVGHKMKVIILPPLLSRLADSVTSSIGSGGRSSGSSPWTMNPLDSEALFAFGKITAAISDWCRIIKVEPSRDAVVALDRWFAAYNAHPDYNADGFYFEQLREWRSIITGKLDPARKFEIQVPCPICGQTKWLDPEGNEAPYPIVVEYRDYGTAEAIKPRALCRACNNVWLGTGSIEELGEELREKAS